MNAAFGNGKVTFTTTHFSTYAVFYEASSSILPGGAIAGIVIGAVIILAVGGFAIFWFVIKKKKLSDLFSKNEA